MGDESNSRAVPGEEQVSVRYGLRLPKFILIKSRKEIAMNFKKYFPECDFSISTIMREFPQNAVTPTNRDLERNTCPIHANARRLVKSLNKSFNGHTSACLPTSCRELACLIMCKSVDLDPYKPLSWSDECVWGLCDRCPVDLPISVPEALRESEITYSLWKTKKRTMEKVVDGKIVTFEKSVFSLYPETCTVHKAIDLLQEMCNTVKLHIYTAHMQWNAHALARLNLELDSVISIEDYQMNMEVVFTENPTSLAYSTNKISVAIYPICVEFKNEDNEICKGAITFISDDKDHSHQQVQQFEKRMFELVRDKLKRPVNNWIRYSDGCSAQFKSGFAIADMFESKELFNLNGVSFNFFESHEGKSVSDSIGSIVKCAFIRGMMKSEGGVQDLNDIHELIESQIKDKTEKFDFFVVEKFGSFKKKSSKSRSYCKVTGIMALHSFKLLNDCVYLSALTCVDCQINELCDACLKLRIVHKDDIVHPKKVTYVERETDALDRLPSFESEDEIVDSEDEGQTDVDTDSDEEQEIDYKSGDIVWAKYGRIWYPAKVCCLADLPESLQVRFSKYKDKLIVKWFGENMYSSVTASQIDVLEENLVDAARAARSSHILKQYNIALGTKLAYA